jgi:branched-chain amino acid transport system ATP-binding protein
VVLLDEVSMGLAPLVVEQIFETLERLAKEGISLLLVEQYVHRALEMCSHVYLLNRGTITYDGPPAGLDDDAVMRGYLGRTAEE